MQIIRLFSSDSYKGTRRYLSTQKRYEILRTVLYFGISLSLFVAGLIMVKSRMNLLTLVAVLGCLPASKSAVNMIMFLRYHSCSEQAADAIEQYMDGLQGCFDMVFTAYDKNYPVAHMAVKGNTICGYTQEDSFEEKAFQKHIDGLLRADGYTGITVKIFKDLGKYTDRLKQLQQSEADEEKTPGVIRTLKSVSL